MQREMSLITNSIDNLTIAVCAPDSFTTAEALNFARLQTGWEYKAPHENWALNVTCPDGHGTHIVLFRHDFEPTTEQMAKFSKEAVAARQRIAKEQAKPKDPTCVYVRVSLLGDSPVLSEFMVQEPTGRQEGVLRSKLIKIDVLDGPGNGADKFHSEVGAFLLDYGIKEAAFDRAKRLLCTQLMERYMQFVQKRA